MGMRTIQEGTSWEDCFFQAAYTADALAAAIAEGEKEIGEIVPRIEAALDQWIPIDAERRDRRRAVGRGNAVVRICDGGADRLVVALHNDTLGNVKQNRAHPVFVRLFPVGKGPIVRLGLESQLPEMRKIQIKLGEAQSPADLKRAYGKPFADAIARGEAAVRGRETAQAALGQTGVKMAAWREQANGALLVVEGMLKKIAGERGLGRGWVEAFFPSAPKKAKAKPVEIAAQVA
ncbi:MAG: hypothetical protein EXR72_06365 [Myxococcales bacterium]|nr:hypothetical protein [Myxococcales bacterium]